MDYDIREEKDGDCWKTSLEAAVRFPTKSQIGHAYITGPRKSRVNAETSFRARFPTFSERNVALEPEPLANFRVILVRSRSSHRARHTHHLVDKQHLQAIVIGSIQCVMFIQLPEPATRFTLASESSCCLLPVLGFGCGCFACELRYVYRLQASLHCCRSSFNSHETVLAVLTLWWRE